MEVQTIVQGAGALLFVSCLLGYFAGRVRSRTPEQAFRDVVAQDRASHLRLVRTDARHGTAGGSLRGGRVSGAERPAPRGGGGAPRREGSPRMQVSGEPLHCGDRESGPVRWMDLEVRLAFASGLPLAEWDRVRRRGVVIHAGIALDDLVEPFVDVLADAGLLARYGETVGACWQTCLGHDASVKTLVSRVNAVLPREHQLRRLSAIDHPCAASLYVLS